MMQYWNEAYYACNVSNSSYLSVQLAGMDGVYLGDVYKRQVHPSLELKRETMEQLADFISVK